MRVLITGAGLIGTHTAKELVDRGDEVTFFDFAPRPDYIRQVTGKDLPVLRGDIRDLAALVDAFQTVRPECVIHLAASVGEANINNVYTGFQINLVAAINVAEAVRLAGVRRLVHASTQAVYSRRRSQGVAARGLADRLPRAGLQRVEDRLRTCAAHLFGEA